MRISDMFDHTGTPTIIARQTMDPGFYTIGYINVRTRPERDLLEMECCAPNRWRDIRADGLYLTTAHGERCEVVEPGGIDRDFPGWDLCFFLFDRLISAFCAIHRQTPLVGAIAKAKGHIFILDAQNGSTIQTHQTILTNCTF